MERRRGLKIRVRRVRKHGALSTVLCCDSTKHFSIVLFSKYLSGATESPMTPRPRVGVCFLPLQLSAVYSRASQGRA